jgi:hypothetical protein
VIFKLMFSSIVSRASALFLGATGLALLFASDSILPTLIAGFPPAAALAGQLLAGAWLGVAALNWLSKSALIGGIYSRPVVSTNALLYFVTAMSLVKPLLRGNAPPILWIAFVPIAAFAVVYMWLLFRGPYQRDLEQFNTKPG